MPRAQRPGLGREQYASNFKKHLAGINIMQADRPSERGVQQHRLQFRPTHPITASEDKASAPLQASFPSGICKNSASPIQALRQWIFICLKCVLCASGLKRGVSCIASIARNWQRKLGRARCEPRPPASSPDPLALWLPGSLVRPDYTEALASSSAA